MYEIELKNPWYFTRQTNIKCIKKTKHETQIKTAKLIFDPFRFLFVFFILILLIQLLTIFSLCHSLTSIQNLRIFLGRRNL